MLTSTRTLPGRDATGHSFPKRWLWRSIGTRTDLPRAINRLAHGCLVASACDRGELVGLECLERALSEHLFAAVPGGCGMTIIALDTGQIPLRMVCASCDGPFPFVTEHRKFRTLEQFQHHWKRHFSRAPDARVAVLEASGDPLCAIPWLEAQKAAIPLNLWLHSTMPLRQNFEVWGLPESFKRAHVLASQASYRTWGARFVTDVWWDLNLLSFSTFELFETKFSNSRSRWNGHRHRNGISTTSPPEKNEGPDLGVSIFSPSRPPFLRIRWP